MSEHQMTPEEALQASWALSEIEAEQVRRGEPRVVYQALTEEDARRVAKEALRDLSADVLDPGEGRPRWQLIRAPGRRAA